MAGRADGGPWFAHRANADLGGHIFYGFPSEMDDRKRVVDGGNRDGSRRLGCSVARHQRLMTCCRCHGAGTLVTERLDREGWHRVDSTCPLCQGRGWWKGA